VPRLRLKMGIRQVFAFRRRLHELLVVRPLFLPYDFNAADPLAIVRGELRRHCLGVDFSSASNTKHFKLVDDNKYFPLDAPIKKRTKASAMQFRDPKCDHGASEVRMAHERHEAAFKQAILEQIKKLAPEKFEYFTKNLLEAYGFEDVEVTQYSKDGGIDGFGQLKMGFAFINVAFQCKRYTSQRVQTKEIREFRGSIQGKCEQGLFFTTSEFTADCKGLMFQPGAVPIIMIDGLGVVDIMIEKGVGVQIESVPVYVNALDLAISED